MRYFYMEKLSQDFLYERFSNIPVAVNNLYGDPFLPNQTEDTLTQPLGKHETQRNRRYHYKK